MSRELIEETCVEALAESSVLAGALGMTSNEAVRDRLSCRERWFLMLAVAAMTAMVEEARDAS